nr:MAG: hint domain protein [Lokiarchaeota virus Skoll Meg22_1214]
MTRITSGLSQVGGKYRLLNTILNHIPYHEFYLEPFLGCYDDKTEILSKNKGWILFKDLSKNDKIACLSKRYELYWENPIALQSYYYEGKMIKISHRSIDLLVTPNHNMYLREFRKDYEFMKANDIKYQNLRCINSVKWNGKEKKYFNLPSLNYKNIEYKQIHKKIEEKWKNKKWLEEQYYKLKKSQRQIAIECGCLQGTIEYWMKKFNMKTRNRSKAMKILYDKGMQPGILNEKKKLPMEKWKRFLSKKRKIS